MKTYYMQVKEKVLPMLEYFKSDLLELDKKELSKYRGEFIHASRSTGTDLAAFDNIENIAALEFAAVFCLRTSNALFLHGINGRVEEVPYKKAVDVFFAAAKITAAKQAAIDSGGEPDATKILYKRYLPKCVDVVKMAVDG